MRHAMRNPTTQDALIKRLEPVSDDQAGALVGTATKDDLAVRIMAVDPGVRPGSEAAEAAVVPPRRNGTRRIALSLAAATAAAAAVAGAGALVIDARTEHALGGRAPHAGSASASASASAGTPSDGATTGTSLGPQQVQLAALSFSTRGDSIIVKVKDPLADPARYRKEFAAHGMNIDLSFVPSSPSIVGTVVMMDGDEGNMIETLTAKGECFTGGGGDACPVGVKIPIGFKGHVGIVFGRAARPGEQYNSTAPVTAPGEVMHGMDYKGRPVAEVLAMLKKRGVTVPEYRYMKGNESIAAHKVPANWYVHDAVPWAKDQVMLFTGPRPTES